MRIETIDPMHEQSWDEFLLCAPQATVFHSGTWAKVLNETYGFQPRYLVAREDEGRIVAGIPLLQVNGRRLVGLPFSDLCPPLLPDNGTGSTVLEVAKSWVDAGATSSLELRGQSGVDLESRGFQKGTAFLQHIVSLDGGIEELEARCHPSARRAIRKAQRAGVTVRDSASLEDMERFYQLHTRTRKKHGLIPQPWRLFENIYRYHIREGSGYLLLAEHGGQAIAADLLLAFKEILVYKFNASDPRFVDLRPNNLLLRSAMELGVSMGCRALDLGRCDEDAEGLRRFKLLWGSVETPLPYFYYPSKPKNSATAGNAVVRRRLLGLFVRFAPLWALRQAGAALYKNFA